MAPLGKQEVFMIQMFMLLALAAPAALSVQSVHTVATVADEDPEFTPILYDSPKNRPKPTQPKQDKEEPQPERKPDLGEPNPKQPKRPGLEEEDGN
jgi:hypothetical protein